MTATPPGAARLAELFGERHRGFPAKIPFVAIIVPRNLKARLRIALASTWNRRRETLFPDLAGLADAVRDEPERISPEVPAQTATR
jgi:predicted Rdx family selenoprotein